MKSVEMTVDFALEHQFTGIEWDCEQNPISLDEKELNFISTLISEAPLAFRFHLPYREIEIAHYDPFIRETSINFLKIYIDRIRKVGGKYFILHSGYLNEESSFENAVSSILEIRAYAGGRGFTILIENLTKGITSNPKSFLNLIKMTNAEVVFDVGHANVCAWAKDNRKNALDFLNEISVPVFHAHLYWYENEEEKHIAPEKIEDILPIIKKLVQNGCYWWTIELFNPSEVLMVKEMLETVTIRKAN